MLWVKPEYLVELGNTDKMDVIAYMYSETCIDSHHNQLTITRHYYIATISSHCMMSLGRRLEYNQALGIMVCVN